MVSCTREIVGSHQTDPVRLMCKAVEFDLAWGLLNDISYDSLAVGSAQTRFPRELPGDNLWLSGSACQDLVSETLGGLLI